MIERKLEESLRRALPLKHFLFTGYARNGLYLLIKAMGWGTDDQIVIPAFTCPIVRYTVSAAGVCPVSVDSEPDGLNIDPAGVEEAVTPRTKAVYVVHTYGSAARIEEICAIARARGLIVIEDLAHSLFSKLHGRQLGTFGDIAVLSFTKKVINFEGGAIGTNHTGIYDKMRSLQLSLQKNRPLSLSDLLDYYARLAGSWWESGFSLPSLFVMKMNDRLNDLLYKGKYGLSIDPDKFTQSELAMRLTLLQLDRLSRKDSSARYLAFRERFGGIVGITALNHTAGDTLPAYCSGTLGKENALMNLLSFRTWHNFTSDSRFPRAEHLYASYRIFARCISLIPRGA